MDLFGLEIEDRQFLPLQRFREDLLEQITTDGDNERFVTDSRVDVLAFYFSKRHRSERLFACLGLGCVLGSERAKGDNKLRLIEDILRQVRSDIFDKFCDLLVLQRAD